MKPAIIGFKHHSIHLGEQVINGIDYLNSIFLNLLRISGNSFGTAYNFTAAKRICSRNFVPKIGFTGFQTIQRLGKSSAVGGIQSDNSDSFPIIFESWGGGIYN